ncbi:MAG: hypothetical protein AABY04_01365 [Candidatus Micrarchaeota archaeon]
MVDILEYLVNRIGTVTSPTNLAIYGALVSTALLIHEIYKYYRDKPDIRVNTSYGIEEYTGNKYLYATISNHGRRTATIKNAKIVLSGNEAFWSRDVINLFPHELNEGKAFDVLFDVDKLFEKTRGKEILFAEVTDQLEKKYRSKLIDNESLKRIYATNFTSNGKNG